MNYKYCSTSHVRHLILSFAFFCYAVPTFAATVAAPRGVEVAKAGCTIVYVPASVDSGTGHVQVLITSTCNGSVETIQRNYKVAGEQRSKSIESIDPRSLYPADSVARDPYFQPYFDRAWAIILSEETRPRRTFSELPDKARISIIGHGLIITNSISLETGVDELGDAYVLSFPVDGIGRVELYISADSDAYLWKGPFVE